MIKIINYAVGGSKKEPFVSWVDDLDLKTQSVVYARLDRVILGNFGKQGMQVVILLIGGDKSTQNRDIVRAKKYWSAYRRINT